MSRIATVFGGSGFVGRYIVRRLAREGWRVRVAVRRPNEALFVRPYGVPGQVEPVLSNIRFKDSVRAAIGNSDAVVNCVGILVETGRQKFQSVHAEGAGTIARACAECGVESLAHVSAIGASAESPSKYAQSKAAGEAAVLENFPGAAVLRPSVVFGPEDQFFNRFAVMARNSPVVPIVGADTLFQPVYVDDVARAALAAIRDPGSRGIYELGGPEVLSFRELIQRMLPIVRRRRLVLNVPGTIALIGAAKIDILQFISGGLITNKILTRDQVRQLSRDNVVGGDEKTLADLEIDPVAMGAVLDGYLYCFRPAGQYTSIHESADILESEGRQL